MPDTVDGFVENTIGPEGMMSVDLNIRINTLRKNIDYYFQHILFKQQKKSGGVSSGESIEEGGTKYIRLQNIKKQFVSDINELKESIKQQYKTGFEAFSEKNDEAANTQKLNDLESKMNNRVAEVDTMIETIHMEWAERLEDARKSKQESEQSVINDSLELERKRKRQEAEEVALEEARQAEEERVQQQQEEIERPRKKPNLEHRGGLRKTCLLYTSPSPRD